PYPVGAAARARPGPGRARAPTRPAVPRRERAPPGDPRSRRASRWRRLARASVSEPLAGGTGRQRNLGAQAERPVGPVGARPAPPLAGVLEPTAAFRDSQQPRPTHLRNPVESAGLRNAVAAHLRGPVEPAELQRAVERGVPAAQLLLVLAGWVRRGALALLRPLVRWVRRRRAVRWVLRSPRRWWLRAREQWRGVAPPRGGRAPRPAAG